jgi:hypothetical protein
MKKNLILLLSLLLLIPCSSCSPKADTSSLTPSSSEKEEDEEASVIWPGQTANSSEAEGPSKETGDSDQDQPVGQAKEEQAEDKDQAKSTLYPPSIFVIEASGSWRQELAPGYYANYECEFYADKLDETDNQSVSGQYTGVFWMKTELEVDDYLKELLKDVPVEMQFDAGGEGVCDFFNVILLNGFERERTGGNYTIPDEQGGSLIPTGETLAARGSFLVEAVEVYLDAQARGLAGEAIEHRDNRSESTELHFILHVEPDPDYTALKRRVTLYLSTDQGMSATLNGVLHRMPGYSEDLKAYTSQGKRGEILNKHLQ